MFFLVLSANYIIFVAKRNDKNQWVMEKKQTNNNQEPKKLNKLGQWLESNAKPLFDLSKLTPSERKSLLRAVMK